MKILEINTVTNGSTGKIMMQIANISNANGNSVITSCGYYRNKTLKTSNTHYQIGCYISKAIDITLSKMTGLSGVFSILPTACFLSRVKKFRPDIIHIHNLHGWYINLPMLFNCIKKHNIRVVWTLHDCWAFTGQCPHFTLAKCDKWKTGCHQCPQYREYPQAYVDRTKTMYRLKKKWFTGVQNLTIITPSQWLAGLVKQSYLKDSPVRVINNGIDLSIFKPTPSNFRERHNLHNKFIVLGIAFGWGKRKGLDVFIELSKRLDNDKYKIVLVGTSDKLDELLPKNILSIHRTQNQAELAEIYTAADVFANPTREEVFGLVNAEALACGTPVLTFRTGGSPEIPDETCGSVVDCDDIDAMELEIIRISEIHPYSRQSCLERAKSFDMNEKFEEYINLYRKRVEK